MKLKYIKILIKTNYTRIEITDLLNLFFKMMDRTLFSIYHLMKEKNEF